MRALLVLLLLLPVLSARAEEPAPEPAPRQFVGETVVAVDFRGLGDQARRTLVSQACGWAPSVRATC